MSVAELPPRITEVPPALETARPARTWSLTIEQAVYLALFAVALLGHLWGLDLRAYHHDETHHAFFSWRIYQGEGYVHDPLLHGPFLYFANALVYFLFGDTNVTARLSVALFGSVLVLLPYLIQRELGRSAALVAAVYLVASPVFLYVGRFIRHDPFAVAFELLAFVGVVRYVSTRKPRFLYLAATALGLMCVTMESFFLYVAIMLPLVLGLFLWRVWKPGLLILAATAVAVAAFMFVLPGDPVRSGGSVVRDGGSYLCPSPGNLFPPANPMQFTPGPILGLAPLPTADNAYGLCVRHQPDNSFAAYFVKLGQFFGHPAVLLTLGALGLGLGLTTALIWRVKGRDSLTPWQRARSVGDPVVEAFASLAAGRRLWVAFGIFFVIYGMFFSAFLTNPVGIVSGMFGSVLYWLAQHDVQRGGQPPYYYSMLLAVYEPLALLWGIVGVAMTGWLVARTLRRREAVVVRDPGQVDWRVALPAMLVWWSAATLFIYSWAGEKMPWLTMHVALPLVLLAAWGLAQTLGWAFRRSHNLLPAEPAATAAPPHASGAGGQPGLPRALAIYLAVVGGLALFTLILVAVTTGSDAAQQTGAPVGLIGPGLLLLVAAATVCYGLLRSFREAVGALALASVLVGGAYTLRSSFQINYLWGDTPREMLIFVQSTPDVARVIERLEQASIRRTGGMDMAIWYDNETIWSWYTRNFTAKSQQQPALTAAPGPEVQAVLMLQENLDTYPQNLDLLDGFVVQRLPMRWWFPEDQYRLPQGWLTAEISPSSPLLLRALRTPFDSATSAQLWQYLLYRQPPGPLGSTDFVIAVRPDLAQELGLGTGATP